jgi:hypothetical protein
VIWWLAGTENDYQARCKFFRVDDIRKVCPANLWRWQAMIAAVRKFREAHTRG